jgi:hypothetical protein
MTTYREIFVRLLDEGVDVWRPVTASRISKDVYRILEQPYDRNIEIWQFAPGDQVVCKMIESDRGQILAAIRPKPRK